MAVPDLTFVAKGLYDFQTRRTNYRCRRAQLACQCLGGKPGAFVLTRNPCQPTIEIGAFHSRTGNECLPSDLAANSFR